MDKIRVLDNKDDIVAAFRKYGASIPSNTIAFYHGGLNAIILDRTLMMIHFFDRQVHRGYAVFDTCNMFDLKLYLFDKHISRFKNSMKIANLKSPKTPEQIKAIMTQIVSLTGLKSLVFRFWCSRGAMNLDITTPDEVPTVFYLIATQGSQVSIPSGISNAYTVNVEVKNPILAEMKSNNYLLNCLSADEAAKKNGLGIMVTEDGYVVESSVEAVGFVLKGGIYYAPPFYRALRSITQERALELIQKHLMKSGLIKGISRLRKTVAELKDEVVEMMLLGGEKVVPIGKWDDTFISYKRGPVTEAITKLFKEDYNNPDMSCAITLTKI